MNKDYVLMIPTELLVNNDIQNAHSFLMLIECRLTWALNTVEDMLSRSNPSEEQQEGAKRMREIMDGLKRVISGIRKCDITIERLRDELFQRPSVFNLPGNLTWEEFKQKPEE